jgi:phospholipid transport system substrate-binding protein
MAANGMVRPCSFPVSARWQIVDVYLAGTVSELATRRSEFSSVMRRGGAEALVDALQKKTAQLRS